MRKGERPGQADIAPVEEPNLLKQVKKPTGSWVPKILGIISVVKYDNPNLL